MNKKLLQEAIDNLELNDLYMHGSQSVLAPNFEPRSLEDDSRLHCSFLHQIDRSEVIEVGAENGQTAKYFRVYVSLGARWQLAEDNESDEGEEADGDESSIGDNTAAKIEAIFVAEYYIKNRVSQDALAEFALNNASYHVWPFWREYLMSQCTRMNLPKIPLPIVQLANNGHLKEEKE